MADKKRVYYSYKSIEAYNEYDDEVRRIIQYDTDQDMWSCNRALPPTCYPPPLSEECIRRVKELSDDVIVHEIED
ncbi:uncharacterized protein BO66DRAFT_441331 [Aspergillus aculeatinus CBS 121060]|uniref:Uncharacterized protein n=1 Tax=Aspergillus aculeatinus CBS 121060 TaxID=1448322 RepID=A0ACD1H0N5_9EURO|nr:hypothetical protein BO66DRAFT_441331 [Aspergillus aculeatinus CBS 121060]RAH67135.1 hypothetical protein BO66DRAFT_441331 [Aspergillus aculeatinus CBS 121060]